MLSFSSREAHSFGKREVQIEVGDSGVVAAAAVSAMLAYVCGWSGGAA